MCEVCGGKTGSHACVAGPHQPVTDYLLHHLPAKTALQKLANELPVAFSLLNSVYSTVKTRVGLGSATSTPAATRPSSPQPDPHAPPADAPPPSPPPAGGPPPSFPLADAPPTAPPPASLSEAKEAGLHAECLAAELGLVSEFKDHLEQTSR